MPGYLVQHNECRLVADQFLQQAGAGGGAILVAAGGEGIPRRPTQLIGQFAPQGVGGHLAVIQPIAGLQVRAHHADHPHGSRDRGQPCFNERRPGRVAPGRVVEGDQVVGLAAAEGSLQADDSVVGRLHTREPPQRLVEKHPQTCGGVGVVEEDGGVLVDGVGFAFDHVFEPGGEDLFS